MTLTQEEIDSCREAFKSFDKDGSGSIDAFELKQVLQSVGQSPSDEDLFQLIAENDESMSGTIDFTSFLKVIASQKERTMNYDDEIDMIDAFVACGGNQDKTGYVKKETLIKIIKFDFGLTIEIEELINKLDRNGRGELTFDDFKVLLT